MAHKKKKQQKPQPVKDKGFWLKLLADGESDTVSSKRLCMLICLIMLIILSVLSAFGFHCMEAFVYIFGSLVGAQSGLTTIEKCKGQVTRLTKKKNDYDDNFEYGSSSSAAADDEESEDTEQ